MNTYSNVLNSRENTDMDDFKRDLAAAVTDLLQACYEIKKKIPKPFYEQAKVVISGKIGMFVSVINLSDKYKKNEDTLSDWLGVSADVATMIAGYTGNPVVAGVAVTLGFAAFLTSDVGVGMANAYLDAIKDFGLADSSGNGFIIPPGTFPPGDTGGGADFDPPQNATSPIILDLDNDGIETLSKDAHLFFDHDRNQFAENTGWVAADDGLLVMDINHNGTIDNGGELFGNNTTLPDGSLAANGYEALSQYDTHRDGVIDQKDAAWQEIKIWRDINSNGQTDAGELFTLEDMHIASINTSYDEATWIDAQGNAHKQRGEFINDEGKKGASADVWFDSDLSQTVYREDILISHDTRLLPYISGFGNMANLHVAMSLNPELKALVEQFISHPQNEPGAQIEAILFSWAGVGDVESDSRGGNIDARKLALLEVSTGQHYKSNTNGSVDPLPNAAELLLQEYDEFAGYIKSQLLAQSVFRAEFAMITYTFTEDQTALTLNFDKFERHLSTLEMSDPKTFLQLSNVLYDYLAYMPSFQTLRARAGIPESKTVFISEGDDTYTGTRANEAIWGDQGIDILNGESGDDRLYGGSGDDSIDGGNGNDTLSGGTGNDYLDGDFGVDTYLFNLGDGQDTFTEIGKDCDTLRFGQDIQADKVHLTRTPNDDLLITFNDSADSIKIERYFTSSAYKIEQFVFDDGTHWNVNTIESRLTSGTDADQILLAFDWHDTEIHAAGGNDQIEGRNKNDILYGDAGNDHVDGNSGNDTLSGGTGNDYLDGDFGADTYLLTLGTGRIPSQKSAKIATHCI